MPPLPLTRNDLLHLHSQISAATKSKLDLYLPTKDPKDSLKSLVASHVDEFILELFASLDGNLEIDGHDAHSVRLRDLITAGEVQETEPFDFALSEEVRKMYVAVEEEMVKLAELRKQGPVTLKEQYEKTFEYMLNETLKDEKEDEEEEEEEEELVPKRDIARLDEVRETYENAVHDVEQLKEEIPNQRSELVKIEQIAEFLRE